MKISPTALVVAALLVGPGAAYAQDAVVQGSGYQVSENTVLHPSVGAETGVISNVFYEEGEGTISPVLRLLAQLALEPIEDLSGKGGAPRDIDFSAGVRLEYQEFLSSNPNARAQRNLGAGVDLALQYKPESQFPIGIEDHFIRVNRPTNFETNRVLVRNVNTLKLKAAYKPRGRNLSGRASYSNTVDIFEEVDATFANRMLNRFVLGADWQFLPITRFFVEGSYGINFGIGPDSTKVGSNPMSGLAGIATAITESVTTRASAGYVYAPYSSGASFSGIVGNLELGYRYSPVGRVRVLYARAFRDSINANFFVEHRGTVILEQQLERFFLQADLGARLRTYQGVPDDILGGATREDVIFSTAIKGTYSLRDWIGLNASYDLASVQTDFRAMIDDQIDDPSFVRHQFLAGATAAF